MGDSEPILSYASPETREKTRLVGPTLSFFFQFVWLFFLVAADLGSSGPKQVLRDSLFNLVAVAPSVIAVVLNLRSFSWHGCRDLNAGAIFSFLFFLISVVIVGWITHWWIVEVLLDPHGDWHM